MSLLAAVNQPSGTLVNGAPQYYFALDSTPQDPTVTAPDFVATGAGAIPVGNFDARGNGTAPFPAEMFTLSQSAGTPQFSLGLLNVPTGVGSVGNDFAISRYDDNGGFQGPMLTITRSSGLVSIANSLSVAGDISANTAGIASALTVGTAATVGGGVAEINGTLGIGTVYDTLYNRPLAGAEVLLSQFDNVGTAIGALVPYTPTNSGAFTLTMEIRTDATGYAWTNGTDIISGYLAGVAPPFTLLSDSFTTCDSLANPTGFFYPNGFPAGVYVKDIVAVINLSAGVAYQPTISINGAFNLGTTGGVRFFIQPLLA